VFVFPSLEESFGLPLVEAMACGAPVVATRSAATPEIAGTAALLCDPASPPALADAILRVLDDAAAAPETVPPIARPCAAPSPGRLRAAERCCAA